MITTTRYIILDVSIHKKLGMPDNDSSGIIVFLKKKRYYQISPKNNIPPSITKIIRKTTPILVWHL
jgi:hypothetical protein